MLAALTDPIEGILPSDLDELVRSAWPESENVEYKVELHRQQDGRPDSWYDGGNISADSKRKIFKELVAFANTSGGRLFIGIGETAEKPSRAEVIKPVPRCAELAMRLEQAVSVIEPPLTFFRFRGIPTAADGTSGVVVADVSASYTAPHQSSDLQCYARKGTNSVPMGMREVHDVVMRLSRRQDEIQRRLAERKNLFERWMGRGNTQPNLQVGFRLTAIPTGAPLYLDRVFRNPSVSHGLSEFSGTWKIDQTSPQPFYSPKRDLSENPVLGGTQWRSYGDEHGIAQKVILRDGLIDTWFKMPWSGPDGSERQPQLQFQWFVALSANVLRGIQAFRAATAAPNCEYAMQLELVSTNGPNDLGVQLVRYHSGFCDPFGSEFTTPALPELYPVGDQDRVINLIVRDLCDAAAVPESMPELQIDWSVGDGFALPR